MIGLISTPWPLFNRPSIQLGSLKAFIKTRKPELGVRALHFYLPVAAALGYPLYEEISQSTWLSEPLYAALLYPERLESIEKFWQKRARRSRRLKAISFQSLCDRLERTSQWLIESQQWSSFHMIGFSVCFSQLTSTLYFARKIKKLAPELTIVLGGSACSGAIGRSLLGLFPEVDYVISGEGELALLDLIQNGEFASNFISDRQINRLDTLPVPDFQDYFDTLEGLEPDKRFTPKIPVEMSRGCWWNKCKFCNLNLQWRGYRSKSHQKVLDELDQLSSRYQVLGFSFMDNLLPNKGLESLFSHIGRLGKDFELFSEIRANTPLSTLQAMAKAGMVEVQVGIEALSSSLLQRIQKGTTALDNLEIMKNCERSDTPSLIGNLILEFPGSTSLEVEETLETLKFASPFRPLKAIPFWLGYGSPVWIERRAHGISRVFNHPYYRVIFPRDVFRSLITMIQGYHGPLREQRRLWQPVKRKVAEWHSQYMALHQGPYKEPILAYRDGGEFLIIRQRRINDYPMTHKLKGTSRKIYLFCETKRTMEEIIARFPAFSREQIGAFLQMMVEKRLMFQEKESFLSLALPAQN